MTNNFEQVHNFYERMVFDEMLRRSGKYPHFTEDLLADVACVALNRLPARYVRHDVDMMFYLTEKERQDIDEALQSALSFAFDFVGKRKAARQA